MEKAKRLKPGTTIWLNCEVSPGPLNEFLVRLVVGTIRWFGFVKPSELNADQTQIRVTILDIEDHVVTIGIRGHSPTSNNAIKTSTEQIYSAGIGAFA